RCLRWSSLRSPSAGSRAQNPPVAWLYYRAPAGCRGRRYPSQAAEPEVIGGRAGNGDEAAEGVILVSIRDRSCRLGQEPDIAVAVVAVEAGRPGRAEDQNRWASTPSRLRIDREHLFRLLASQVTGRAQCALGESPASGVASLWTQPKK